MSNLAAIRVVVIPWFYHLLLRYRYTVSGANTAMSTADIVVLPAPFGPRKP